MSKNRVSNHSDHFNGEVFFNPSGVKVKGLKSFFRWVTSRRKPWPKKVNRTKLYLGASPHSENEIQIVFINHVTFLIRTQSFTLITDPLFSERASPFSWLGPKRVCRPGIELDEIPEIQSVLLSHNHYDHMDLSSLKLIYNKFKPQIVVPLRNGAYLEKKGIKISSEMDWWEKRELGPFTIWMTPAQHWSARGLFDRNKMLWGSYIIEYRGKKIFFAGDTGYGDHFNQISNLVGSMEIALLPIGAYEPRWFMKGQHMNPEDAVKAHLDLKSKFSLGMHFGTFRLTNEGIDEPEIDLKKALEKYQIETSVFQVPAFGQTYKFIF